MDRRRKKVIMEIQLWRDLLDPYQLAIDELMVKFKFVIKEYRSRGMYCPIEAVNGRVKKISSILEKMRKKNLDFDDIEDGIEDIAGIRIICQFVEDIDAVVNMIKNRTDMMVKTEKDYINNPKASGYRSYHMIVYYDVMTINGTKRLKVELQIRTLAMNFWATIEHSLKYKYRHNIPEEIKDKLTEAAQAVVKLDKEMSAVRDEITDAQNLFQQKANLVAEILNTIENLYSLANKREIIKIQDEFYMIYKQDDIDKLRKFSRELDFIAEGYRAQGI